MRFNSSIAFAVSPPHRPSLARTARALATGFLATSVVKMCRTRYSVTSSPNCSPITPAINCFKSR